MKLKIIIALGLLCGIAMAQTTPNLNFNIPAQGTPNWGPLINANFSALDSMLSGLTALPKLNTTNGYQVGGVTAIDSTRNGFLVNLTVSGTCTGCGTAGAVTSVGATSPVLSSGGSTPTISISGVTALQGNASKLQLATGTTTTGHFPSYDASGNLVDSTQPSGGATLPSNAVVYGLTAITSRAATFTDVVALWTSCGTNFLKGNGTCAAAGGTPAGTTNDVQINLGGSFGVDTGVFTYTPSTHILNAGQGITTTSTGVATTLGLSGGTTPGSLPTNSFGWLGPSSATFTSYFFQCPTTPPTNGQTIVFGTQVGSVVPCTYATSATGNVSNSGTPLVHQPGIWVDSTHIAGGTAGTNDQIYMGSTGADPSFVAGPSGGTNGCAGTSDTPTYNTTTHAWGCHQITGGAGTGIPYAAGGGTADAQTVTLSPAWTSYVAGTCIAWSPIAANATNTPTLAVNGLAALPIVRVGAGSPGIGDLTTTQVPAIACLDGTAANFQLQNPNPSGVINAVHTGLTVDTTSAVNHVVSDDSFTPTVDGTYEFRGIISQTAGATGCSTQGAVKFILSGVDADTTYAYLQTVTTGWGVTLINSGGAAVSSYIFLGTGTPAAASSQSAVNTIRRWKAGTAVHIGLLVSTQPVGCTGGTQHTLTDRVQIYKVQ